MLFKRLRDLREDHDKTQYAIASLLGIAQTVYSRYERGFQTIPLPLLIQLADYYRVSIDYIIGRTDEPAINGADKKTDKDPNR